MRLMAKCEVVDSPAGRVRSSRFQMSNPLISNAVNVVVVEDDPVVRGLLCDSISAASGLSLNAALATKKAALDWLAAHQPDVLLTDLGLPDG